MPPPWLLDESAHAGAEHLDADFVAGYDRKQGTVPDDAATTDIDIFRAHGLGRESTVVDLGCGTGRFAVAAAPHFRRVVAVDVSPVMLDAARERASAAAVPNVEFVRGGFLSYEADGPADAVHTRNALHQLPDFWKTVALSRIARLLRPGGVLRLRDLVYDCGTDDIDVVFDRWLAGGADAPHAGYTADDLAEHIRSEHSTFRWLLEPMLEAAGFRIVDADFRGAVYGAYTCVSSGARSAHASPQPR